MSQAFKKVVRLGTAKTYRGRSYSIFCKIEYSEDGRLSITGVEGPTQGGNALGSCGQIDTHLRENGEYRKITPAPGWTTALIGDFLKVWDRWHLNDMKAGDAAQEAFLRPILKDFPGYPTSHYKWCCDKLGDAGLLVHDGYQYGTAWKREEVPAEVLAFLHNLPNTDKQPAWV